MKQALLKYFAFFFLLLIGYWSKALDNKKILFEENKGQIVNDRGERISDVLFRVNLSGVTLWITERGITYNFYKYLKSDTNPLLENRFENKFIDNFVWYRSEMNLKNAVISLNNLTTSKKEDFYNNYFSNASSNAVTTNCYNEITFSNIYEGIDWHLFVENNKVKQEFIVHAFANPGLINSEYKTSGDIKIENTKISFLNSVGVFTEGELYCYQKEKTNSINAKYSFTKETKNLDKIKIQTYNVKINTGNYDHCEQLIIDPILDWSTLYGGGGDEDGHSIYNDGTNTWVAGHTLSFNFPTANPGSSAYFQGSNSGGFGDIFILKFNNTGNLLWATYFGGSSGEESTAIYSNGSNVWVSGYTGSTDFPILDPGNGAFFSGTNAGGTDGFILKFNTAGALLWSTYCGGINNDIISTLHCNNNELFIAGTSDSPNFPTLNSGNYFQNYSSGNDGFIMKFNATNNLQWSTFIGGAGNDLINTLQTNGSNIYIGGYTNSADFVTLNSSTFFQSNNAGSYDCFISKFSLNGNLNWSTYFGGNNLDKINSLTLNNNSLWVTGISSSTNMPLFNPGGTSFNQATNNGFSDGFVSKFDLQGALQWSSYYGGSSTDFLTSITTDGKNVFVSGYTNSTNIFTQNPGGGGYHQNTSAGFYDGILLKFDTASACKWASYFGNASNDYIHSINCNGSKIFTTGYTQSNFFPTLNTGTGAYYQSINASGLDCFISTFKNCVNPTLTLSVASPPCVGSPLNLAVNGYIGATYQWFGPLSFISSLQNPSISNATASNSGNYSLIVNVPNGCNNSGLINVTVNSVPSISITSNSPICDGDTLKLNTLATNSYSWAGVGGFSSNNQNPIIINSSTLNTGVYNLTVTNTNSCSNSSSVAILVNPLPAIAISSNSIVCLGGLITLYSNPAQQYNWTGPNAFASTNQNPIISNANLSNQGYYLLTISDVNNCKQKDSTYLSVNLCTSLSNQYKENTFIEVYPNPAINFINVNSLLANKDNVTINILNVEGKKLLTQKIAKQIDISIFPCGVYLLTINYFDQILGKQKFIKINN